MADPQRTVTLIVPLAERVHDQLRVEANQTGVNIEAVIIEAIAEYLSKPQWQPEWDYDL